MPREPRLFVSEWVAEWDNVIRGTLELSEMSRICQSLARSST